MASSTIDRPPPKKPLPPNKSIQKRPLLHPLIHAPLHTSQDRIIYISAFTPFVSAVKRVEGFLASKAGAGAGYEVTLKATGRAIDRALQVGCYFLERGSEKVVVRTGTVDVVDDVVEKVGYAEPEEEGMKGVEGRGGGGKKRKRGKVNNKAVQEGTAEGRRGDTKIGDGKVGVGVNEEEIYMKTRKTSMVEIIISSAGND